MRAGELNTRITFLEQTRTSDGSGGATLVWSTYAEVWAKVKTGATTYGAGKELVKADKLEPQKVFLITVRFREDLDESMRVLWRSHTLEITAILYPDTRQEMMQVLAKEVGLNVHS